MVSNSEKPIVISATVGKFTLDGNNFMAACMLERGKDFLASAMLLQREKGNGYVVLHNICTGIELLLKGLLLHNNYKKYKTQLKHKFGHDLIKLTDELIGVVQLNSLKSKILAELTYLNDLYNDHNLRYAGIQDIFIQAETIPRELVLRRVAALIRMMRIKGIVQSKLAA